MGWLGPSGSIGLTGARWSAGAFWADSASPAASDSVWEELAGHGFSAYGFAEEGFEPVEADDSYGWPRLYPLTTQRIPLGVYIAGEDFTSDVMSVGWLHGSETLLPTALAASSANITLSDAADPVTVGDRVVVLTEYDVLWVGRVEEHTTDEQLGQTTIALSCVDDLNRASLDTIGAGSKGTLYPDVLARLLDLADVPVVLVDDSSGRAGACVYYGADTLEGAGTHEGTAVAILGDALRYAGLMGSYTPRGLRVRTVGLWVDNDQDVVLEGAHDLASTWSTQKSVSDVVNRWTYPSGGDPIESPDPDGDGASESWPDSQRRYGTRTRSTADKPAWWSGEANLYNQVYVFRAGDFADPPERIAASYHVSDTSSLAYRVIPLDRLQQDSDDYIALRVSHSITVDGWSVTLSGYAVTEYASWAAAYPGTY